MRLSWVVIAAATLIAGLNAVAADPALARIRHKVARHCADQTRGPTVYGFFLNSAPQPNGCAPPVYAAGRYVGQDPDPFIRQQLNRDPQTGYWPY